MLIPVLGSLCHIYPPHSRTAGTAGASHVLWQVLSASDLVARKTSPPWSCWTRVRCTCWVLRPPHQSSALWLVLRVVFQAPIWGFDPVVALSTCRSVSLSCLVAGSHPPPCRDPGRRCGVPRCQPCFGALA